MSHKILRWRTLDIFILVQENLLKVTQQISSLWMLKLQMLFSYVFYFLDSL